LARTKPRRDAAVDMESPNERGDIDPIIDKIRRGEISVIEAVAEELPDVCRTHVVPKLCLKDTLDLARVNKSFYEAVWSAEGFESIQKKCTIWYLLKTNNTRGLRAYIRAGVDLEQTIQTPRTPRPTDTFEGTRPLHLAIMLRHSECTVLLIEAGCDVNVGIRHDRANPLCMALMASTFIDVTAIVSALVEAGADVNARCTALDPSESSFAGYTPLGLTVIGIQGDYVDDLYEIPKILLDAGADPNATSNCGNTALHLVVQGAADEKMVKLLLDAGADTSLRNDAGRTPLELAIPFNHAGLNSLLAIASS